MSDGTSGDRRGADVTQAEARGRRHAVRPRRVRSARHTSGRGLRPADTRSRRRTLVSVMALVAMVLIVGIPIYAGYRTLIAPETEVAAGRAVEVTIPVGSDTAEIAEILAGIGVIDNGAMFRLRARLDEVDGKLRPGTYQLATGMPYGLVLERLLAGPPLEYVTITIPEGLTVDQIAERFESQAGIPAEEIVALAYGQAEMFAAEHPYLTGVYQESLEGYLFPKTYRVLADATAADVIEMMLDQFDAEMASVDLSYTGARGMSLHEVVTLASMIEREARVADERPLVSSVIYNRLDRGMRLEIDATIEYVIRENRPRLLNRDLEIDSPYNTYRNAGLPPGPIASPGLAALQAAAAPAQSNYIYYVLTSSDGSHTFAETYEEFLIAKEKSREVTP